MNSTTATAVANNTQADELVFAYGNNGLELMPKSETVEIPAIPQVRNPFGGDGIPIIAAAARMFSCGKYHPKKLETITMRPLPQGGFWLYVEYTMNRPIGATYLSGKKIRSCKGSCYIRNKADAADPWFSRLPERDHAQITVALAQGGAA